MARVNIDLLFEPKNEYISLLQTAAAPAADVARKPQVSELVD
jgi:hypothetical protein